MTGNNMSNSTLWWLVTGLLVAAELVSGTFYLLMLALGAVAAALAAHFGANLTTQLAMAAFVGGLAVVLWRQTRLRRDQAEHSELHLDIGETLHVDAWDEQGTAQVKHRGAAWTAINAADQAPSPGLHRIQAIQGNRLVLEKI